MWPYLATFLASLASDSLPIIGPPVWTILVFMQLKFDLNPWLVLGVGVPGSVLGRYALSLYSTKFLRKFITTKKANEMEFVGKKLDGSIWKTWPFVLIYSLLPLSTTANNAFRLSELHEELSKGGRVIEGHVIEDEAEQPAPAPAPETKQKRRRTALDSIAPEASAPPTAPVQASGEADSTFSVDPDTGEVVSGDLFDGPQA